MGNAGSARPRESMVGLNIVLAELNRKHVILYDISIVLLLCLYLYIYIYIYTPSKRIQTADSERLYNNRGSDGVLLKPMVFC